MNEVNNRARTLCVEAGIDPDSRIERPGLRPMPAWTVFRPMAELEQRERAAKEALQVAVPTQVYSEAPLYMYGPHSHATVHQMVSAMSVGNVLAGVLCADGHLGYGHPVGGVIAYADQISVTGVGGDIGCGNMAVCTNLRLHDDIHCEDVPDLVCRIAARISFGVRRHDNEPIEHPLFEDDEAWRASGMRYVREHAIAQLGTVGGGNHYVDLFTDEAGYIWVGVHFGSRGLGAATCNRFLKLLGGRDGIDVLPTLIDTTTDLGREYIAAMTLAGRYAEAGREWVVREVCKVLGAVHLPPLEDWVRNHHNFAWQQSVNGQTAWVVRKGSTPAMPGEYSFVGGSMGTASYIIQGLDTASASQALFSTVHGAGRAMSRGAAKRKFSALDLHRYMRKVGIHLHGGDVDEHPASYKSLADVLRYHDEYIRVVYTLRPLAVFMAPPDVIDPFKD